MLTSFALEAAVMLRATQRVALAVIALATALLASAAARGQDEITTWVEGHVFNKWTGVPLENVVIQVGSYRPPLPGPGGGIPRDYTDANGFYSIEFFASQPDEELLSAVCFLPPKDGDSFPHSSVESGVLLRRGRVM